MNREPEERRRDERHHPGDDVEQERGLRSRLVAGALKVVFFKVPGYSHVAGAAHVDHEACRVGRRFGAASELSVAPLHERLRHEDGVQTVGEAYYAAIKVSRQRAVLARQPQPHRYAPHDLLRNLRKACGRGETEIVERQVVLGDDDRYIPVAWCVVPVGGADIDEPVGY